MKRQMMKQLIEWKERKPRKPLLLKGVRQVGKTYLLKEFGRCYFPRFHYFNFEKQPGLAKIFEPDLVPDWLDDSRLKRKQDKQDHYAAG